MKTNDEGCATLVVLPSCKGCWCCGYVVLASAIRVNRLGSSVVKIYHVILCTKFCTTFSLASLLQLYKWHRTMSAFDLNV